MTKNQTFRDLVIDSYKKGIKAQDIFKLINNKVSETTVYRWICEYNSHGKFTPSKSTGRPNSKTTLNEKRCIKRLLTVQPTLSQRAVARHKNVSRTTIWRVLKEMSLKVGLFFF